MFLYVHNVLPLSSREPHIHRVGNVLIRKEEAAAFQAMRGCTDGYPEKIRTYTMCDHT